MRFAAILERGCWCVAAPFCLPLPLSVVRAVWEKRSTKRSVWHLHRAALSGAGQASPADERGGELGEAFMRAQVPVSADGEAFELVEVGDGLLDDPPDGPESDDLLAAALRDDRIDPFGAQPVAESAGVVAAVGQDGIGSASRASDPPGDRPNSLRPGPERP